MQRTCAVLGTVSGRSGCLVERSAEDAAAGGSEPSVRNLRPQAMGV